MEKGADYIKAFQTAERRFVSDTITFRANPDKPEQKIFRGYAAKYNTRSNDLGGFTETIAPGFFDGVLGDDVRALRDHDPSLILGRTTSGTCRVGVDANGLYFEFDDPGTSYSRDLAISIERGDVNQCSFAFSLPDKGGDKVERMQDGSYFRTLIKAERLYDVSVVTYPAYNDTSVAARSIDLFKNQSVLSDEEKTRQVNEALEEFKILKDDKLKRDKKKLK